jgi:hypothetical protein
MQRREERRRDQNRCGRAVALFDRTLDAATKTRPLRKSPPTSRRPAGTHLNGSEGMKKNQNLAETLPPETTQSG